MTKVTSRIVGVFAIVLSAGSAVLAVYYWSMLGKAKHGLLFTAVFVVLLIYGILSIRAKGRA